MAILLRSEIDALGFASVGEDVRISDKVALYNCSCISLGNHVRIDDYCVLSAGKGGIEIHDYIHIAVYCSLIGEEKITISDFANLSSRVSIYSSNDDYTGMHMTNPMVPPAFTGVVHEDVFLGKHVIIGSGSVILPGAYLDMGSAVGSLSLVKGRCEQFKIYAGVPARPIGERQRNLLLLEAAFRSKLQSAPVDSHEES
jgi:galactoside O-acetyltransferase